MSGRPIDEAVIKFTAEIMQITVSYIRGEISYETKMRYLSEEIMQFVNKLKSDEKEEFYPAEEIV